MSNLVNAHKKAKELAQLIGEAYFEANNQRTAEGNLLAMHIEPDLKAAADLERKLALLLSALEDKQ